MHDNLNIEHENYIRCYFNISQHSMNGTYSNNCLVYFWKKVIFTFTSLNYVYLFNL